LQGVYLALQAILFFDIFPKIAVMVRQGPIVLVDDDRDDQEFVEETLCAMGVENKRIYFFNCHEAFTYLKTTKDQPLLILCDINIPGQNGLEFKKNIDEDPVLRRKSIPFVFLSTAVDQRSVDYAYKEMTVQGFFKKENTLAGLQNTLSLILSYWTTCRHPNSD
jgi:CheY-like chemotaxis protein